MSENKGTDMRKIGDSIQQTQLIMTDNRSYQDTHYTEDLQTGKRCVHVIANN